MEKTTVSRRLPSGMRLWLRRTPSCLAPSRKIAVLDWWFSQCVRNSTAMQPSASNAWVSSRSLLSALVPVRWAERAFQVDPISTRRLSASAFKKVVIPITAPVSLRRVVKGRHAPGLLLGQSAVDLGTHGLGRGHVRVPKFPQLTVAGGRHQIIVVVVPERLQGYQVTLQSHRLQERHVANPNDRFQGVPVGVRPL